MSTEVSAIPPTIGRIVHYVGRDQDTMEPRLVPGIITAVEPKQVALTLFYPGAERYVAATYDPAGVEVGTWHWPIRR